MKLTNKHTIIILYFLTLLSGLLSNYSPYIFYATIAILIFAGIKFLLVAFQFMEMKKAHPFWKNILVIYISLFILTVGLILYK